MMQEIPAIIDYLSDFINRLGDFEEWNHEVYILSSE